MPRGFNEISHRPQSLRRLFDVASRIGCGILGRPQTAIYSVAITCGLSLRMCGNADLLPATDWLRGSKIALRNSLNLPSLRAAIAFCDVEGKSATKGGSKETGR
jgi:hypothetical protein